MIRVQTAICAQSFAVDRVTNRLSLFNVLDAIQSQNFPVLIPEFVVVVLLTRELADPAQFDSEATFSLDDQVIARVPGQVGFQESVTSRHVIGLQSFPIAHPGQLQFRYSLPAGDPFVMSIAVTQPAAEAAGNPAA